jgi:hypothetical protein
MLVLTSGQPVVVGIIVSSLESYWERCFVQLNRIVVWEAFDVSDPMVKAAAKLYESTLAEDERIPWVWIEKSVENRTRTKPGGWTKHLLLAAPEGRTDDPSSLAGYVYGALIPGYGGYLCYIGVANWARRMGIGTRLYDQFFRQMSVDAGETGEPLPFVMWTARTKLFERVGGLWVEGVDFYAPNMAQDDDASTQPVPMQLFLKPMTEASTSFNTNRLKEVIGGLHLEVYRNEPGDTLYDLTLPASCHPRLRPAKMAAAAPRTASI